MKSNGEATRSLIELFAVIKGVNDRSAKNSLVSRLCFDEGCSKGASKHAAM